MRPVVCMITGSIPPEPAAVRALVDRIRTAARAGVHLVQVRQHAFEARDLTRLVEETIDAVRGTAARVAVNERVDVALAAGAHGVHLRGDSMPGARVRAISPTRFLIGRSVHSPNEAQGVAAEGGLDYLLFGAVFATRSKPGAAGAGLGALAATCASVPLPVLAVGGMTAERLGEVGRAGAAGFAAIGLFAGCELGALGPTVANAVRAFDTP